MGFLGVYKAIYDYVPQGEGEIPVKDGDLMLVIEKNTDDDWWKAKRRAATDDEDEPEGLIPNNYVEEAQPSHSAKALYEYARQTDEELSFSEEASFTVYDTSDPDWTLVGLNGEYGFVPANYIELSEATTPTQTPTAAPLARTPSYELDVPESPRSSHSPVSPIQTPAAALAGILAQKQSTGSSSARVPTSVSPPPRPSEATIYTPDASDEEPAPVLPARPPSQDVSPVAQHAVSRSPKSPGIAASPPYNRATHRGIDEETTPAYAHAGGFRLYNINEVVAVMGKQKKVPTTLGINIATGNIMISPAKSRDGEQQEWSADKLTNYSIEGKRIFMELIRPAKSVDFHAGAKDTAQEIVAALGELAGAARAEGLREVLAVGTGKSQKKGQVLYDFKSQGDDEVSVTVGDEVIVINDTTSDEWWMVRRLKNGKEGVVPSTYVEVTGTVDVAPERSSSSGINAGRSTVEQNRLEEERLARESSRLPRNRSDSASLAPEVGPGVKLPERGSSLMARDSGNGSASQRSKRESKSDSKSHTTSKSKPDDSKMRTWTDRSGAFRVEAEFIGCKDGKIHLHKLNGVKIAVPVAKMAPEDLEYVERVTGMSLDEDKPLSDIRRQKSQAVPRTGATVQPKKDDYDWFDFFLQCGVNPHQCERYAANFSKDSMDESVLPDITTSNLRTLGLKEGDSLRVMKFLDKKYGRTPVSRAPRNVSFGGAEVIGNGEEAEEANGGLFSGPGGALRNNTRKGRPAPAVQTSDVVDAKVFQQNKTGDSSKKEDTATPLANVPPPISKDAGGFDDDAWDIKPSKQQPSTPSTTKTPPPATAQKPTQPALTGSMQDLSLLSQPLQPTVTHTTGSQPAPSLPLQTQAQPQPVSQVQNPAPPPQQSQPTGANPSFFSQLNQPAPGVQPMQNNTIQSTPFGPQQTGYPQQQQQQQQQPQPQQQQQMARQRPQAPQIIQTQGSLMPPPPPRPLSAPQNTQQNSFGPPPLQPQLTGYQNPGGYISQPQPQLPSQLALPGQSLNEISQIRQQQQFLQQQQQQQQQQQHMQPQMTGFPQQANGLPSQPTGYGQMGNGMMPQTTGFAQQPQQPSFPPPQQFLNTQPTGSPFGNSGQQGSFQSLAPQPTGYLPQQQTGINSVLPPPLQPQPTGPNGFGGQSFGNQGYQGMTQAPPPVPPMPQQIAAPLQPQKTGPPPPVRFGVAGGMNKLAPQPTGRRANLSQATPENPFGF